MIFPIIAVAILVLLIAGVLVAVHSNRISKREYEKTGKHPKGHYMSIGLAIGIPLGIPLGIALGNIALGPALGLPIGAAIGQVMEKKHADELRPLTPEEEEIKRKIRLLLFVFLFVVLAAIVVTMISLRQ